MRVARKISLFHHCIVVDDAHLASVPIGMMRVARKEKERKRRTKYRAQYNTFALFPTVGLTHECVDPGDQTKNLRIRTGFC